MKIRDPQSVGLGGDGDEIDAVQAVEQAFGVELDYAAAADWHTAGDVFQALLKALPENERERVGLWHNFAAALCGITGVDPRAVEHASPLLEQSHTPDASAALWIVLAAALIAIAVLARVLN